MSTAENTVGKGELLVTSNFSFAYSVFYPFGKLLAIFIKFESHLQTLSVRKGLKFVVWERVNVMDSSLNSDHNPVAAYLEFSPDASIQRTLI